MLIQKIASRQMIQNYTTGTSPVECVKTYITVYIRYTTMHGKCIFSLASIVLLSSPCKL